MDSKPHFIRLKYPAPCDRCGGAIQAGEWAAVVFCEENGTAQFYHKNCPTAGACVTAAKPKKPGLLSRALRRRPRSGALSLATCPA